MDIKTKEKGNLLKNLWCLGILGIHILGKRLDNTLGAVKT